MRVCIVVESYPPDVGGIAVATEKLAEGLAASGVSCVVITTRTIAGAPKREDKSNLSVIRVLSPKRFFRLWFSLAAPIFIFRYARDCTVVHGTTYGGAFPAWLCSFVLRNKSVLTVFEFLGPRWETLEPRLIRAKFYRIAEQILARLPYDKFVAISNYTKTMMQSVGIPEVKSDVIYLGANTELARPIRSAADVRKELGFSPEHFLFMAYGRTGITKGIDYFVRAMPAVLKSVSKARFLLILSSYDRREWTKILKGLEKVPPRACVLKQPVPRQKLADYLNAADCVVIPSLSEGFGFTALEACSIGKPVVATRAGALPEVVYGKHVFVHPGLVKSLFEGCVKAFKGEYEFTEPRVFRWEETIRRYTELYDQLTTESFTPEAGSQVPEDIEFLDIDEQDLSGKSGPEA